MQVVYTRRTTFPGSRREECDHFNQKKRETELLESFSARFSHGGHIRKRGVKRKTKTDFSHSYFYVRRIFCPALEASHLIPLTPSTLPCSLAEAFAKTLMTCLFFHTIEFVGFRREGRRSHRPGRNREHATATVMHTTGQSRVVPWTQPSRSLLHSFFIEEFFITFLYVLKERTEWGYVYRRELPDSPTSEVQLEWSISEYESLYLVQFLESSRINLDAFVLIEIRPLESLFMASNEGGLADNLCDVASIYIHSTAIPVTGRRSPWGRETSRLPIFSRLLAHRWRCGCQPFVPTVLFAQEIFRCSFLLEALSISES
jgi:hypothetical protein